MGPGDIIRMLGLQPHPEGGWYAETWRADGGAARPGGAAEPGRAPSPVGAEGGAPRAGGPAGRHDPDPRPTGSAIYFLLEAGQSSAWHRVDATEMWHFHAGAPLELLTVAPDGRSRASSSVLGLDLAAGQRPQLVVPENAWQTARSLGDWTLVGCTVSPAFSFDGFELAPPDWQPGKGPPDDGHPGGSR